MGFFTVILITSVLLARWGVPLHSQTHRVFVQTIDIEDVNSTQSTGLRGGG